MSETTSHTWSYSGVSAQQVEDALTTNPRPIVLDDFHHVDPAVRVTIAKAIKPLLRKTFIVLVAIPSHSFDPAKTVADIGGRMTQFKIPDWTVDELTAIGERGLHQLNVTDPNNELSKLLANYSFGSPHIMQELCYALLSKGLNVHETVKTKIAWIPSNFEQIVEDTATESEPFAFQAILAGRYTKGEGRKDIRLKDGGITDSYGITLLAIRSLIPPIIGSPDVDVDWGACGMGTGMVSGAHGRDLGSMALTPIDPGAVRARINPTQCPPRTAWCAGWQDRGVWRRAAGDGAPAPAAAGMPAVFV
jgi:hypothetical protein